MIKDISLVDDERNICAIVSYINVSLTISYQLLIKAQLLQGMLRGMLQEINDGALLSPISASRPGWFEKSGCKDVGKQKSGQQAFEKTSMQRERSRESSWGQELDCTDGSGMA